MVRLKELVCQNFDSITPKLVERGTKASENEAKVLATTKSSFAPTH